MITQSSTTFGRGDVVGVSPVELGKDVNPATASLSHSFDESENSQVFLFVTVCPGSSDTFHVVSYYIKWVTTSWTHGTIITDPCIDWPALTRPKKENPDFGSNWEKNRFLVEFQENPKPILGKIFCSFFYTICPRILSIWNPMYNNGQGFLELQNVNNPPGNSNTLNYDNP